MCSPCRVKKGLISGAVQGLEDHYYTGAVSGGIIISEMYSNTEIFYAAGRGVKVKTHQPFYNFSISYN